MIGQEMEYANNRNPLLIKENNLDGNDHEGNMPPMIVGSIEIQEELIDKTQVVKLKTDIQESRTP